MTMWSALRARGLPALPRVPGIAGLSVIPGQRRAPGPVRRHVWVLSGGGARGAAQVGAMAALLSAGIRPVALVGCSVGALNAAFMAGGPSPERADELAERWCALGRGDVFGGSRWSTVRNVVTRRAALFSPAPLAGLIDAWLPAPTFEELAVPLRVVTTSLTSGRPVYHDRGPLREVLLASAALPGLFPPVVLPTVLPTVLPDGARPPGQEQELHVDGGVTDLVPIAAAVEATPTDVWVLDVAATAGTGQFRVHSALDVLVASLTTSMRARPLMPIPGARTHHLVLRGEDTGPRGLMDFSRTADLVARGHACGEEALAHYQASLTLP